MKKTKILFSLALFLMATSCVETVSTEPYFDDSNGDIEISDASDFTSNEDESSNVGLSKLRFDDISDYVSIGYGNVDNVKNAKYNTKSQKINDAGYAYSYADLYNSKFHKGENYALNDAPFTLVGETNDGTIEKVLLKGDGITKNVNVDGFMNLGEYIAFTVPENKYYTFHEPGASYILYTNLYFFSDYLKNKAEGDTYLLSKRSGKVYYVGNIDGFDGWNFDIPEAFNEKIFINGADKSVVLYEENDTLKIKTLSSIEIQNIDQYGNVLTNVGILSSDLKNHKILSFFNGEAFEYAYVERFNKIFAKKDDKIYSLNEDCEFIEAVEILKYTNPKVTLTYASEGNGDEIRFGEALWYSELKREYYALVNFIDDEYYDPHTGLTLSISDLVNLGDIGLRTHSCIDMSKPWTWILFGFNWIKIYDNCADENSTKYDADYTNKWEDLHNKLVYSKLNEITESELEEIFHKIGIENGTQEFIDAEFGENGLLYVSHNLDVLGLSSYTTLYEYDDVCFMTGSIDQDIILYESGNYSMSFFVNGLGNLDGADYSNSGIFRGKNLYYEHNGSIYKYEMSSSIKETLNLGNYSLMGMYVEDGNIAITGTDEELNTFVGYLDENDQITFEKTGFGENSEYTLYPIN